jgi:hypothetical protein
LLLALVGWALGLLILLIVFRMAGDRERAAHDEQERATRRDS